MKNKTLIQMILSFAEYYQIELSDELGKTYVIALENYNVDWNEVFIHFVKNQDKFPTVNQIIKFIDPNPKDFLTHKQQGLDLLDEVLSGVRKFGWNNFAEANLRMSREARLLVSRLGGWERVCKVDTTNSAFMAQARDLAEVIVTKGTFEDQMIALHGSKSGNKELSSSEDILKSLTELKKDE